MSSLGEAASDYSYGDEEDAMSDDDDDDYGFDTDVVERQKVGRSKPGEKRARRPRALGALAAALKKTPHPPPKNTTTTTPRPPPKQHARQPLYRILTRAEVAARRQAACADLASVLGLAPDGGDAARVLRAFGWDSGRAQDAWFARNDEVRARVGLALPPDDAAAGGSGGGNGGGNGGGGNGETTTTTTGAPPSLAAAAGAAVVRCAICFDDHPVHATRAAACGHPFCEACWAGYAAAAVQAGPAAALDLRCPTPGCGAAAPSALLRAALSEEDRARYDEYCLRSYVEDSPSMAWCPGAGCDNAAERLVALGSVATAAPMRPPPLSGGGGGGPSSGGGGGRGGGGGGSGGGGGGSRGGAKPAAAAAAARQAGGRGGAGASQAAAAAEAAAEAAAAAAAAAAAPRRGGRGGAPAPPAAPPAAAPPPPPLDPTSVALLAAAELGTRPPRGAGPLPNEPPPLDVLCCPQPPAKGCGATFCFACGEEAHRPVACGTVRGWLVKNSAESENLNWILANTKPCPKCHRPIEKNQGCMHMTCSQCRHEFCWLCSGAWAEHGERTGGFYACNRFEAAAARRGAAAEGGGGGGGAGGVGAGASGGGGAGAPSASASSAAAALRLLDADARRREDARASLSRYMHYYERFDAHHRARLAARRDAARAAGEQLEQLSELARTPTSQLRFVADAWRQVGECRRVLKWTYAYGYYAFEGEGDARWDADGQLSRSRQFFEFLQGDAERSLDQLHEVVEMRLAALREGALAAGAYGGGGGGGNSGAGGGGGGGGGPGDGSAGGGGNGGGGGSGGGGIPTEAFAEFRRRLVGLTDVTRSFFEKLVGQLERGFGGMGEEYAGAEEAAADTGSGGGGRGGGPAGGGGGASASAPARAEAAAKAAASARAAEAAAAGGSGGGGGPWRCDYCTLSNSNASARACEMCGLPRGGDGGGGGGGGGAAGGRGGGGGGGRR